MALEKFHLSPLPTPPPNLDREVQEYLRQVFRVLETYLTQVDSLTPNQADSYRADFFYHKDSSDIYWKSSVDADGVLTLHPQRDYNTAYTVGFSTGFQ